MLSIELSQDIQKRLNDLSKQTGKTTDFYVREAIIEHLEDLEDYYLAELRLKSNVPSINIEQVEKELGLAN
jgi:RHH-type rel operon transcriptional repressor/antitoxin RelB